MLEHCHEMAEKFTELINRHDFFILTTHDTADADGIGAQLALACILKEKGKQFRIINASPMPGQFRFMDPLGQVEAWNREQHEALPGQGAMIIMDTAEENNIGIMREACRQAREVFVIDHHEISPIAAFDGIYDPVSSATCELAVELAGALGVTFDPGTAFAAYIGLVYDNGFFGYPKTGPRAFGAAQTLLEQGADPSEAFIQLCQNGPNRALLLQKKALAGMVFHYGNRIAVQALREEDFIETGAFSEDTDGFVNFPLRSRDVIVSFFAKEMPDKKVRCSLRSKGKINVAKIAQEFGGGGHPNAAGFRSDLDMDQTLAQALAKIIAYMER